MTDLLGDRAVGMIARLRATRSAVLPQPPLHRAALAVGGARRPRRVATASTGSRHPTPIMHYDGGSLATYARDGARRMDEQIGRVLAALDRNGLAGDTIVVFTSDNGGERFSDTWPFTGRKTELLEGGMRIPAIVRWPGRIRRRHGQRGQIMTMDWLPTLLTAAGTRPAAPLPARRDRHLVLRSPARPLPERTLFWRYQGAASAPAGAATGNI